MKPWVLKLGGSVEAQPQLRHWIREVVGAGGGRLVVTPGGGRHADRIRAAQQRWQFPDATAHRMALLAMEQFGDQLVDLAPELVPVTGIAEMRSVLADGGVALWLPYPLIAFDTHIPASWDVTSDSLSLWLAGKLDAELLVLVKMVKPMSDACTVHDLARLGIVDTAFTAVAADYSGDVACLGWEERERMPAALMQGNGALLPLLARRATA